MGIGRPAVPSSGTFGPARLKPRPIITKQQHRCEAPNCGKFFTPYRPWQRYCPGGACKQRARRARVKARAHLVLEPPQTVELLWPDGALWTVELLAVELVDGRPRLSLEGADDV